MAASVAAEMFSPFLKCSATVLAEEYLPNSEPPETWQSGHFQGVVLLRPIVCWRVTEPLL